MTRPDQLFRGCLMILASCFVSLAIAAEEASTRDATSGEDEVQQTAAPEAANSPPRGTDTIYMTETVISGNQELPRVLYIVPWRDTGVTEVPDSSTLLMPQLDNIQPLNPREFRRQLDIHESVAANADKEK